MGMLGYSSASTSTGTLVGAAGEPLPAITLFVCANCARPGEAPTSAGRPRPSVPNFAWPWLPTQIATG